MRTPAFAAAASLLTLLVTLACDIGVADTIRPAREFTGEVVTRSVLDIEPSVESRSDPEDHPPEIERFVDSLSRLEIAERDARTEYNRSHWRHWVDSDRDCQNTRAETLIEESSAEVSFDSDDNCRVTAGEWVGPWSGAVFTDASDVDIDHHVPLAHAHVSGGWWWERERKRDFANDLSNPAALQAVDASVNRSKGKQPPDQWRPEVRESWCRYAADWISVKSQWDLTVTESEVRVLNLMLETCGESGSWGLSGGPQR